MKQRTYKGSVKNAKAVYEKAKAYVQKQGYWNQTEIKAKFHLGYGTILTLADLLVQGGVLQRTNPESRCRYYQVVAQDQIKLDLSVTEEPVVRKPTKPKKDYRTLYFTEKYGITEDDILEIVEAYGDYYE